MIKILVLLLLLHSSKVYAEGPLCAFFSRTFIHQFVKSFCPENKLKDPSLPQIPKLKQASTSVVEIGNVGRPLELVQEQRYHQAYVHEIFEHTLGRKVQPEELNIWMNVLSQGGSREGLYRALALGNEYRILEDRQIFPSEKSLEFSQKYMNKFLKQDFDLASLRKANYFLLKREVIEKFLEMSDELSKRPEDLYSWYAILSVDLASDFQPFFFGIRAEKDGKIHSAWAKAVPFQHVKSELILKLQVAFNSFLPQGK